MFLFFEGQAQRSFPYYTKKINKYNSKFNQNIVSDIILDDDQILWIATPTSLFQYNGSEIKQIESPNKNRAVNFFKTGDNKIVLLYSDGSVYELNKNKINFYFKDTSQNDFIVNYQYLSVKKKYLNHIFYNPKFKAFYYNSKITPINNDEIIHTTQKKNIKILSIYNFKEQKNTIIATKDETQNAEYIAMKEAWFLIKTDNSIQSIYNPNKYTIEKPPISLQDRKTYKLINKNGEVPILVAANKIWILLRENKRFYWEEIKNDLPEFISIQSGRYSRKLEKLFLATESDGLIILTKNKFTTIYNNQKIHKSNYYLQIINQQKEIFTNGGSVDKESVHNKFFKNHVLNNNYIQISNESILISDDQHILTYNFKTKTEKKIYHTERNSYSNFIKIGQEIFIVGNTTILKYDPNSNQITPYCAGNFGRLNIDVIKLINHKIWIGSADGICVFDPQSKKIIKKILNNITVRNITHIDGEYYICTYGDGIMKIDSNQLIAHTLPFDFSSSLKHSHCIIEDKNKLLWIATNTGLLRFTKSSFINSLKRRKYIPEPEYFDTEDGLLTDEFNGGASPAFIVFGDTFISLPTIKGIVQFNPLNIHTIENNYQFHLNKISYLNKVIDASNNIYQLTNNIEEITIDFDVIFWGNIKNMNLFYQINGIENKIEFKDIHQVKIPIEFYKNGVIEIFTYNRCGKKVILKKINVYRELPWFMQFKFILLSLLVIYLISFFISKLRTNRVNKRNEELEKLIEVKTKEINQINLQLLSQVNQLTELNNSNTTYISVINHDIFAPIKYINIIGDKISQNSKKIKKEDIISQFNHIINSTKRLELLCSNILNYINSNQTLETSKSSFCLNEMVEEMRLFLSIGLEINHNEFNNKIAPNTLLNTNRDALNIVLTNVLSNANRFTHNGQITLSVKENKTSITMIISDSGKGMSAETLQKIREKSITVSHKNNLEYQSYGIGYSLIYKMLDILNASFEIDSKPNNGTTVKITIPK